jgi:hypothetical protein
MNSVPPASTRSTPKPALGNADSLPQDDDERFIVGLVLRYYRRHPQRARTRLLDLLGEVLTQPVLAAAPASLPAPAAPAPKPAALPRPSPIDSATELAEWRQSQQGTAPLKPKKR